MCFAQQSQSFRQFEVVNVVVIATAGVRCHVVAVTVATSISIITAIIIANVVIAYGTPVAVGYTYMRNFTRNWSFYM